MSIIISMGQGMLQKVSILVVRTASTLELRRSFEANWTAGARAADVSKLKGDKALKATDLSNLPSDFINTALDSASVAYSEVTLTVAWDSSNEVFTFTGADGKAATFTAINEGDTVIFDQTGLGSNDPVLKFSTDAAGTTAPTSGITEATGKTTVSFANNSGASVAGSSADLYIYAEAKSDSSVVGTPVAVDVQDTKTVYGSTETFPWGGSETAYYVKTVRLLVFLSHILMRVLLLVVIAAAVRHTLIRTIIGLVIAMMMVRAIAGLTSA